MELATSKYSNGYATKRVFMLYFAQLYNLRFLHEFEDPFLCERGLNYSEIFYFYVPDGKFYDT